MHKKYAEYFTVPQNYAANMTREAINVTPDTWMNFYPHETFLDIMNTLLVSMDKESKSLWIHGNYGTGKSNAALVIEKLFMDDETRVNEWFTKYSKPLGNADMLKSSLFQCRHQGTLVIYDYNASGLGAHDEFIVRLEKGMLAALRERNLVIPPAYNLNEVLSRVYREGDHFFQTRDALQGELTYLNANIVTAEQLERELLREDEKDPRRLRILSDVQRVLHHDNIYLSIDASSFRNWVKEVLKVNNLRQIVYLFDEFSEFVDQNKEQLKTFEDVSENPNISRFFFVPVTHRDIKAFWAENSAGANKARSRFHFRKIEMPNDIAFRLAANAMKPIEKMKDAWENEKNMLWESIRGVVDQFSETDVKRELFRDMLPIHPMAAFLLKHLSEAAQSNQRSIFEYLWGSAQGHEYQDFISTGGPEEFGRQFLTADYLWKFFMERDDLGLNKEIEIIRQEYERICRRLFSNRTENDADLRVLRTIMLFCLMERLQPNGHKRLIPTIENIRLCFIGDGAVSDIPGIIKKLEKEHTFSVLNGNIELFASKADSEQVLEKASSYEADNNTFNALLCGKLQSRLEADENNPLKFHLSSHASGRFDVRVSDVTHTNLTSLGSTKNRYGKNDDTICLWFVVSKDAQEQLMVQTRIEGLLKQLYGHRILCFAFPRITFCSHNANLWKEYCLLHAQYVMENDTESKKQLMKSIAHLESNWMNELLDNQQDITKYEAMNEKTVDVSTVHLTDFKKILAEYSKKMLPYCPEHLEPPITAFHNAGLSAWAIAGMTFEKTTVSQQLQLINKLKKQGVNLSEEWFLHNEKHPFAAIRSLFQQKSKNTLDQGGRLSIREVSNELQHAPYGLRYNALSAFSMGAALSYMLRKGYYWTDGKQTLPLDKETLAEIIDTTTKTFKPFLSDKASKNEKFICHLSKEDKEFIEKASGLLGFNTAHETNAESVLSLMQAHIERISGRVPLWTLKEIVDIDNDAYGEAVKNVLNNLCTAFSISSKGAVEERTQAIREIGRALLNDKDITSATAKYVNESNFLTAFHRFVDRKRPDFSALAVEIGDMTHNYCQSILEKTASTSGWLWKEVDVTKEINQTFAEYEATKEIKNLLGFKDFLTYAEALQSLKEKYSRCKLPRSLISSSYPSMNSFFQAMENKEDVLNIQMVLKRCAKELREIYLDPEQKAILSIIKKHMPGEIPSDDTLRAALLQMNGVTTEILEEDFWIALQAALDKNAQKIAEQTLQSRWRSYSGSEDPSLWALENHIPTKYALLNFTDREIIVNMVEHPENFSVTMLNQVANQLSGVTAPKLTECQNAFIRNIVPKQYKKITIDMASLVEYLENTYGINPNEWPEQPDIGNYIKKRYKSTFAPQVMRVISKKSPEELKERLLSIVKENPDIGLLFWE